MVKTPKFKKGDIILLINKKRVKVIDVEVYDNLILYYTDDKSCHPEHHINPFNLAGLIKIKYTQEENDKLNEEWEKNL